MSIVLVGNSPPTTGVGRYSSSLHAALRRLGLNDIRLMFTDPLYFGRTPTSSEFDFIYNLQMGVGNHIANFFVLPLYMRRVSGLVHITSQALGVLGALRSPTVVTVHDIISLRKYEQGLSKYGSKYGRSVHNLFSLLSSRLSSRCSSIICVSKFTQSEVIRRFNVPRCRTSVISNGVNHEIFRPRERTSARALLNLPKGADIILNVGDEGARKNTVGLFRSFSRISELRPKAILLRVGEPSQSSLGLTSALGLKGRVVYLRSLDDSKLAAAYNASDVLLHPSFYEGFGMTVLEAMASKLPVVTTNQGAIPELVGRSGVLCNPLDYESMAMAATELIENRTQSESQASLGAERSMMFSWEACAAETIRVYSRALS